MTDVDRMLETPLSEVYFNPSWEKVISERDILRRKKEEIWKRASLSLEFSEIARSKLKTVYIGIKRYL